ncbi:MAG: metal-dependent hydrolase [Clostridia bacterium]|nr:metal-dependent hydrolase [Clostridia bacterium]
MDPISHGLVGMVLGLKAGGSISLANGLMMSSLVGSILPDLDIVFLLRGDFTYLQQHRGISHSLPGAVFLSGLGALTLSPIYSGYSFISLFFWVLLGVLSHLFFDVLNSYGAKVFWPLSSKKHMLNLLPLVDPVLILLCLLSLWRYSLGYQDYIISLVFAGYLLLRWALRLGAQYFIETRLLKKKKKTHLRVCVLPSAMDPFRWDFIIEQRKKNIVGSINLVKGSYHTFQQLKCEKEKIRNLLTGTVLGKVFRDFTPFFHVSSEKKDDKLICHFMDLRYRVKNRFLHNGTLILNHKFEVEEAIFQPYSMSRRIYL